MLLPCSKQSSRDAPPSPFTPRLHRLAAAVPFPLFLILAAPATLLDQDSFPARKQLLELSLISGPPIGLAWTLFLVETARRLRPACRSLPGEILCLGVAGASLSGVALAVIAEQHGFEEFLALAIVSTPGWILSFGLLATALPRLTGLRHAACVTGMYAMFALLSQLAAGPADESRNAERALLFQSVLIALTVFLRLVVWWKHEDETMRAHPS